MSREAMGGFVFDFENRASPILNKADLFGIVDKTHNCACSCPMPGSDQAVVERSDVMSDRSKVTDGTVCLYFKKFS